MGQQAGKALLVIGLVIAVAGVLMIFSDKLPWLFRLPGDITIERRGFRFYFPITTCVIISILVSLILWFVGRK